MKKCKDIAGQRFGHYTALRFYEVRRTAKGSKSMWWCRCDCGTEKAVRYSDLVSKNTKKHATRCRKCAGGELPVGEGLLRLLFSSYQVSAERRRVDWILSKEEFKTIIGQSCYYCGVAPSKVKTCVSLPGQLFYNGVDRVDNSLGYFTENVVPCCWDCNSAKGVKSKEEFLSWVEKVYHHGKQTSRVPSSSE